MKTSNFLSLFLFAFLVFQVPVTSYGATNKEQEKKVEKIVKCLKKKKKKALSVLLSGYKDISKEEVSDNIFSKISKYNVGNLKKAKEININCEEKAKDGYIYIPCYKGFEQNVFHEVYHKAYNYDIYLFKTLKIQGSKKIIKLRVGFMKGDNSVAFIHMYLQPDSYIEAKSFK